MKMLKKNTMLRRRVKGTFAVILAGALFAASGQQAVYADYISGEQSMPKGDLIITTVEEFNSFADSVTNGNTYRGKTVRLGADIDFSGGDITMAGNGKSRTKSFDGIFEGDGHTLSGIDTALSAGSASGYAGIFAVSGESAVIRNVKLSGININFQYGDYSGALVGYHQGTLENCKIVNSELSSAKRLKDFGGLVGISVGGKIYHCMNINTSVAMDGGGTSCGGIVGNAGSHAEISRCGFTGSVDGGKYAGGIVGFIGANMTLRNCYSAGGINTRGKAGGIAGVARGVLSDCYYASDLSEDAYGDEISSDLSVSGVMGKASYEMTEQAFVDLLNAENSGKAEVIPWAFGGDCIYPQPADVYAIDTAAAEGGFVNCAVGYAYEGKEISFYAGADARYQVERIFVRADSGEDVAVEQTGEQYTFVMPKSPVVIGAEIVPISVPTEEPEETMEPKPTEPISMPAETLAPVPTAPILIPTETPVPEEEPDVKPAVKVKNWKEPQAVKAITVKAGAKAKIKVNGSFIKSKTFKSTNKKVATVSRKGVITAKRKGKCRVKATVKYYKENNANKVVKKTLVTKVTVK